jgi:hypothetical protein
MISTDSIKISFTSLLLALVFLLPSGIQLAHALESHEHPGCEEFSTHIHEKPLDCSLCDFQISIFDFTPDSNDQLRPAIENFKSEFQYHEINTSYYTVFTSLRGPPYLV